MAKKAELIVRKRKGYVPAIGQSQNGIYVLIDPVFTVDLNAQDIMGAFERALTFGHPVLPHATAEEWRKRVDPILTAAKVKSWKKLAQGSASYGFYWDPDTVTIDMSRLDRQGRFESDPTKRRVLPKDTPLRDLVEIIMEDIRSRPELWEE